MRNPDPRWPAKIGDRIDYTPVYATGVIHSRFPVVLKKEARPDLWALDVMRVDGGYLGDPTTEREAHQAAKSHAESTGVLYLPDSLKYVHSHFYTNRR